jgi:hypothetical protein
MGGVAGKISPRHHTFRTHLVSTHTTHLYGDFESVHVDSSPDLRVFILPNRLPVFSLSVRLPPAP